MFSCYCLCIFVVYFSEIVVYCKKKLALVYPVCKHFAISLFSLKTAGEEVLRDNNNDNEESVNRYNIIQYFK